MNKLLKFKFWLVSKLPIWMRRNKFIVHLKGGQSVVVYATGVTISEREGNKVFFMFNTSVEYIKFEDISFIERKTGYDSLQDRLGKFDTD